jgi:hypothetical protein
MYFLGILIALIVTFIVGAWGWASYGDVQNNDSLLASIGIVGTFLFFISGYGLTGAFFSESFDMVLICGIILAISIILLAIYIYIKLKK